MYAASELAIWAILAIIFTLTGIAIIASLPVSYTVGSVVIVIAVFLTYRYSFAVLRKIKASREKRNWWQ